MNEDPATTVPKTQEKDFKSLIGQMNNHGVYCDKMICEINDILDIIKQNRKLSSPTKQEVSVTEVSDIISQFRMMLSRMALANTELEEIISRLNELV